MPASPPLASPRLAQLDALRGFAMLWMAVFHFCFDLSHFGLIQANFYVDPVWTWQRTGILSLFLLCAGAGQAVALHAGQSWASFSRRWVQVAACALLVSLGSAWMFPQSFIYFGVLHGMAVMLVLVRCLAPLRRGLWLLAPLCLGLAQLGGAPVFDSPWTDWTGLYTHKPITEDHVPLLPWLGVMCGGFAGMALFLNRQAVSTRGACGDNVASPGSATVPVRWLAALGRWSLSFYMLHQPVLIGGLSAWMAWQGRALP